MPHELMTPPDNEQITPQMGTQMSGTEYARWRARERSIARVRNRRIKSLMRQGYNRREAIVIYNFEEERRHNEEQERQRLEDERRRLEEELEYISATASPRPIYSLSNRAAGFIRNYYNKSKKKKKKKRKKSRKNKK